MAGLTRPEGNLFAAAVIVAAAVLTASSGGARNALKHTLLYYVLPGAAYFAARYAYYGHPFPVPYYLKLDNGAGVFQGHEYVASFLLRLGGATIFAAAAVLWKGCRAMIPASVLVGAGLLYGLSPHTSSVINGDSSSR